VLSLGIKYFMRELICVWRKTARYRCVYHII